MTAPIYYAYVQDGIVLSVGNDTDQAPSGQIAVPQVAADFSIAQVGGAYLGPTVSIFGPAPGE